MKSKIIPAETMIDRIRLVVSFLFMTAMIKIGIVVSKQLMFPNLKNKNCKRKYAMARILKIAFTN